MITLGLDEARRQEALALAEQRAITQNNYPSELLLPPTTTGVSVSNYSAFQVSAWWNGINVIAGDIGVLDRHLHKRVGEDDRERVSTHPVAKVLEAPNEHMVPLIFWQTLVAHVLGWGNAYAEIEWDQSLRPIALWPILPSEIEPVVEVKVDARGRRTSTLWYRYCNQYRLESEDVLHFPGLGYDGIKGYSVVALARQSLGLALAAERFGGALFGNGAWPGLVLEHPKTLSSGARERLRESVSMMHQGVERGFRTLVAEEGMKVSRQVTVDPDDAQAMETRAMQIEEVARWLNLPPYKLKHKMGERPGNNDLAMERDYHVTTLLPWTTLIDQEVNRKLISKVQRGAYYVEHNYARRLQATAIERQAIQKGYLEMGVLTAEQIARQENLPAPKPKDPPPTPPAPAPVQDQPQQDQAGSREASARRAVALDAAGRWVRREATAAKRASKKGPADFQAWAEGFYGGEADVLQECIGPAVGLTLAVAGVNSDARTVARDLADGYAARSKAELLALPAKDLEGAVARLVKRWETTRAIEIVDAIEALGRAKENGNAA